MIREQISVLLIEGNAARATSIHSLLSEAGAASFSVQRANSALAATRRIAEGGINVLIFSPTSSDASQIGAVRDLRTDTPNDIPIIVIGDRDDQQFAIDILQAGAQDYLVKEQITSAALVRSVLFVIARQELETSLERTRSDTPWESSQMLKRVLDHMPGFVFWKDRNSVYMGCNSLFATNAGLRSPEEIIGLTDFALSWKDHEAESYQADDQKVMTTGIPKFNYEETQRTSDGRTIILRTSKIPLRNSKGHVVGVLGTFEDITERKLTEAKLAEAESKYRSLVEDSLIGVYLIQKDRFAYVNECMARMFGYDQADLIGRLIEELVLPEDRQFVIENVRKREADHVHSIQYSFRGVRKDGRVIEVEVLGSRTKLNGRPAVLGSIQDVTERKRAEKALRQLNRELRAITSCNQTLLRATDEKTLVNEICRLVCEDAGYRMAWVGYCEHDEQKTVRPIARAGVGEGYLATVKFTWSDTERGRGPTGTAIRTGKSVFANIETDEKAALYRDISLQFGFRSVIALPLKDEVGTVFGNLSVLSSERDAFGPEEIRLLEGLAADLAFGIVTLRARVERKRAERIVAILSFALDNVREAAILTDERACIRYVNDECCRLLGRSREDLLKLSIPDIDPDFPFERWLVDWKKLKEQQALNFEGHQPTADGRVIPVEISANYFEYEGNGYCLGLVRDISGRKQAEEERATHLHFFESMARVNRAIQRTDDLELAMGDVLEEVLSIFGCDRAFLLYPCDPDASSIRVMMERTRAGSPGALELGIEISTHPETRDALRKLLASKEPVEFGPNLEFPLDPHLAPFGVQSQICTVLYPRNDKPYVFGLHQCSRMKVWTPSERRLLQEIGLRMSDSLTSLLAFRNLRDGERRLEEAQRIAHVGAWDCDLINDVVVLSDEILRIYGLPPQETVRELSFWREEWLSMVHPDDRGRVQLTFADALENAKPYVLDHRIVRPSGEERHVRVIAEILRDSAGRPYRVLGTTQDITEVKREQEEQNKLRQHLQQAQKMEAVGHLAGGIAHDFNNILGVIIGYSELVFRDPNTPEQTRARVEEIISAGQRAASLTRRLLAFSRKLVLQPQVLNLNEVIEGFEKMLRPLLGDEIEIKTELAPNLGLVQADPSQIEQVLLNLCINARDAMPDGGTLTIETKNVDAEFDLRGAEHFSKPSGPCVKVTVRDTGTGMDEDTLSHLFEPFFTTKEPERGTGLGLATVYGIVKQSGGHIQAESKLGEGATFTVYLPRTAKIAKTGSEAETPQQKLRGSETVLLVEDAAPLRSLLSTIIQEFGYNVLEAGDGEQALQVAKQFGEEIAILVTDVSMPKMKGSTLAKALLGERPLMRVLFMSGHSDNVIAHDGVLDPGSAFLQKPFTPEELARKMRQLLDAPKSTDSHSQTTA